MQSSQAKDLLKECCPLEAKLRHLLNNINESEWVNNIVDFNVTNLVSMLYFYLLKVLSTYKNYFHILVTHFSTCGKI